VQEDVEAHSQIIAYAQLIALNCRVDGRSEAAATSPGRTKSCASVRAVAYEWVRDVEAVTVAYVRGTSLRQVGELLHFDWATERLATLVEAERQQDHDTGNYVVQVEQRDKWLVLIEPNGYLASMPNAVSALSDLDVAVSVYWNVNAQMRFAMYADGVLVRSFDSLLPDLGPEGRPLAEEAGLPFGVEGEIPEAAALTLAERLTGVSIDRAWLLDQTRPTWTATGYQDM
jgi:hypothetical protein